MPRQINLHIHKLEDKKSLSLEAETRQDRTDSLLSRRDLGLMVSKRRSTINPTNTDNILFLKSVTR